MSGFDSNLAAKVLADFTPSQSAKYHDLLPAKDVIAELRKKGASYRAIADLLTRHNVCVGRTAITAFCHEILGEPLRSKRRTFKRKVVVTKAGEVEEPAILVPVSSEPLEPSPTKTRGPRIAQVRLIKPSNS